nr:MAG TPA: hypothetical protein [Caudoviricetes sp.]
MLEFAFKIILQRLVHLPIERTLELYHPPLLNTFADIADNCKFSLCLGISTASPMPYTFIPIYHSSVKVPVTDIFVFSCFLQQISHLLLISSPDMTTAPEVSPE